MHTSPHWDTKQGHNIKMSSLIRIKQTIMKEMWPSLMQSTNTDQRAEYPLNETSLAP